jgi:glycerol-3-phosphate dehydrogenase
MGELIASGLTLKEALSQMTMVAEGVETARSTYQLALKNDIKCQSRRKFTKRYLKEKALNWRRVI